MTEVIHPTILLVDDEPKNLRLLGSILQQQGYEIEFATSGAEALHWMEEHLFDLILLDVMMPEMDGFEVCRQLKNSPQSASIPVIFLTARTDSDSLVQGFSLGAVDYITKPIQKEELLARVRTHLTLRSQAIKLEQLNASKDQFFSIIAHDLRSPLTSFLALSNLLYDLENLGPETLTNLLGDFRTSGERLLSLLDNLLTWARIQRGMITANPMPLDLREMVQNCMMQITTQATGKNIGLINSIPARCLVTADSFMLDRILHNLLTNAIKFTPPGGTVEAGAEQLDRMLKIFISDTGMGIPQGSIGSLFEIGIKTSTPGTSGEKGTGLGLILCREFVEKNGGEIWAENRPGSGAIFYFTIPLAREVTQPDSAGNDTDTFTA